LRLAVDQPVTQPPCRRLRNRVALRARLRRVEGLAKTSICILRLHKARLRIEHIAPVLRTLCKCIGNIVTPQLDFGNAVANTTTLNLSYGLGLVAEGTGILLNNELDDFAAKPGAPNAYGLVGGDANAPGPGKRPLSSMTPTIVLKDGKPFLVTGSPGGSRIITTVLQVIVNVIDRKLSIADAIAEPRLHHQWSPDEVMVERGFSPDLVSALKARGHDVVEGSPPTSANSILVTPASLLGAADNRTRGALAAGY
jgi:gamma-glutamyltranspeptidase / glutathione hydrolase